MKEVNLQGFGTTTKIFTGTNGGAYLCSGDIDLLAPATQVLDSTNGSERIIINTNIWVEWPRTWKILEYLGPASQVTPEKQSSFLGLTWGKIGLFSLATVAVVVVAYQLPKYLPTILKKNRSKNLSLSKA